MLKYILPVLPLLSLVAGQCTVINERKEIREMSADEQQRYARAVTILHSEPDNNRERFTDLLSRVHVYHFNTIHNSGFFLPWHRYLLRLYEQKLQNIDPSVVLPYWDWSLDYRDPASSIVLSPQLLGGNGNRRYNYCVVTGAVSTLRPGFPSPHCLRREYDGGRYISSLSSIEDLELLLNEDKFSRFSSQLEIIHGELHSHVGGDFKQRYSNADPLFYLHHGFMDNLFTEWLLRHPNFEFDSDEFRSTLTLDSKLVGLDGVIRNMLDSSTYPLCYKYKSRYPNFSRNSNNNLSRSVDSFDIFKRFIGNQTIDELTKKFNTTDYGTKLGRTIVVNKFPKLSEISDEWIENNGFDKEKVRKFEEKRALFRNILNQNELFKPVL